MLTEDQLNNQLSIMDCLVQQLSSIAINAIPEEEVTMAWKKTLLYKLCLEELIRTPDWDIEKLMSVKALEIGKILDEGGKENGTQH